MRFKKNDDTYFEFLIRDYKPSININYKLVEGSNREWLSIDRGSSNDTYSTEVRLYGEKEYIAEFVRELTYLRNNQKPIEVDEFDVDIFGDHIEHTGMYNCYVEDFGEQTTPMFKVQEIKVVLTVRTSELSFKPEIGVPDTLDALTHNWKGFGTWQTQVQRSYTDIVSFVDREADTYMFTGTYQLKNDDVAKLINWWRQIRGSEHLFDESVWGATDMFGAIGSQPINRGIITNMTYRVVNHTWRDVTINIVRNG